MKNIESVRKLKESLLRHYGAALESVRIFGSVARDTIPQGLFPTST